MRERNTLTTRQAALEARRVFTPKLKGGADMLDPRLFRFECILPVFNRRHVRAATKELVRKVTQGGYTRYATPITTHYAEAATVGPITAVLLYRIHKDESCRSLAIFVL